MFNPLKLFKGKNSSDNAYIGILFKEQEGVVFYLQVNQGVMRITQQEQFRYSDGWEHLVDDIDDVLYRLEQKTGISPNKSIMFIYSHFIDKQTNQIRKPYLQKIKELSKSLDLNPLGFIECHEAVLDLIASQSVKESASLIIEVDQTVITIILARSYGKDLVVRSVARSGSIIESISALLEELAIAAPLPNSLYVYCSRGFEEEATGLMRENWKSDVFSARPIVHIIQEAELFKRLVVMFGKQMLALPSQPANPTSAAVSIEESVGESGDQSDLLNDDPELMDDDHGVEERGVEASGVVMSGDELKQSTKRVMGFTVGGEDEVLSQSSSLRNGSEDMFQDDVYQQMSKQQRSPGGGALVGSITSFFTNISTMVKRLLLKSGKLEHKGMLMVGAGVVLVVLVLAVLEYGFHKATIQLTMPSQIVSDDVVVTQKELGLQSKELKTTLQAQVPATGVKNIGEKAKGSVTIYNSSLSDSKTFKKGTQMTGPSGLVFIFDDEVKVASASGDASSITSSTAKVAVTAANLGSEYNLGAGTKFSVDNESSSSIIAKNDGSFTGGSKRQVKSVSKDDIAALHTKLSTQAVEYTKTHAKTSSTSEKVLDILTKSTLTNEKYSQDEGDEADTVSATADAAITYAIYAQSTVEKIFVKELQNKTKSGLSVQPESIQFAVKPASASKTTVKKTANEGEDATTDVTFAVKARAVKRVDSASVKKMLLGKNINNLSDVVKNALGAQGYEVIQNSQIPLLSQWVPFVRSNLTIQIRY